MSYLDQQTGAVLICPHCQHNFTSDEMCEFATEEGTFLYDLAHREDVESMECPVCDKSFWVRGGWHPTFTTAFAEEELG